MNCDIVNRIDKNCSLHKARVLSHHANTIFFSVFYLRWLETLFEKCEKNGFEHDIVDYYRVLKDKEYHSGMQK